MTNTTSTKTRATDFTNEQIADAKKRHRSPKGYTWIPDELAVKLLTIELLEKKRQDIEHDIAAAVGNARKPMRRYYSPGASWQQIGRCLGITKQAAQKRYDRKLPFGAAE